MMLLVSGSTRTTSRIDDPRLGALLRPGNGNRPGSTPWAIDNGAFANFIEDEFLSLLEACAPRARECLWVAAPDVVARSAETLERFEEWEPRIRERGYRVALVAQDGLDSESTPWSRIDCLFVGGSTEFKVGPGAAALVVEAKARGKLVHMGRVNTLKRAAHAHSLGCDSIDGTAFSMFGDVKIPWMLRGLARLDAGVTPFESRVRTVASPLRRSDRTIAQQLRAKRRT